MKILPLSKPVKPKLCLCNSHSSYTNAFANFLNLRWGHRWEKLHLLHVGPESLFEWRIEHSGPAASGSAPETLNNNHICVYHGLIMVTNHKGGQMHRIQHLSPRFSIKGGSDLSEGERTDPDKDPSPRANRCLSRWMFSESKYSLIIASFVIVFKCTRLILFHLIRHRA